MCVKRWTRLCGLYVGKPGHTQPQPKVSFVMLNKNGIGLLEVEFMLMTLMIKSQLSHQK